MKIPEQEVLRCYDITTDPFCKHCELGVWLVGCTIGILTGIMLIAHGYINVGSENVYAATVVIFGIALIGFCGVLMRCKFAELSQKFDNVTENSGEMYLQRLDPNLVEAEWKRYRKLLAKASMQKGVDNAD